MDFGILIVIQNLLGNTETSLRLLGSGTIFCGGLRNMVARRYYYLETLYRELESF